jgi:hypothetical protein
MEEIMININLSGAMEFSFPGSDEKINLSTGGHIFKLIINGSHLDCGRKELTDKSFRDVQVQAYGDEIKVLYKGMSTDDTGEISVDINYKNVNNEVLTSISIHNTTAMIVKQVQFPYIECNSVNTFDSLLMPTPWGDNIQRPYLTIKQYSIGKDSGYWVYDYIKCIEDEVIYTYPSILAMQYMVLHNSSRSLYLSSYNTGDETFTLNARVLHKEGLGLSVNHYPFLEMGTWTSPECGFSILPGDWHVAADLYGSHMKSRFTPPDIPAWMKSEFHGWVEIGMKQEGKEADYKFKDIPVIFKEILRETGINCMNIAGWSGRGHDTLYPDFKLNPELGTIEELKNALNEVKAMGGHAILYTNGRLVDLESEFYKTYGGNSVCLNEKGEPYTEEYSTTSTFAITCPGCQEYTEHMAGEAKRLIEDYGAHAMQLDQISCNFDYFCFDKNHYHSSPSTNFLPGIERELKEMRKVYKALDGDFFMWCEGCHERFGQYYDINQGHGEEFSWQIGESMPQQFSYNYPDYIVTGHCNNMSQLVHSYVQGKPMDIKWACYSDSMSRSLIREFLKIRKENRSYFFGGKFIDNKGLEVNSSSGVKAFAFMRADSEGTLVNLWQPGGYFEQEYHAYIKNPVPGKPVSGIYPHKVEICEDGSWFRVSWRGPAATVVFE